MRALRMVLIALVLVGATGCDSYLRERDNQYGPKLPDDCHALYKHIYGDDKEADDYKGIYCKVPDPTVNPTPEGN